MLGISEKVSGAVAGMTVQDETRAMSQTATTRSRFMITDILNSSSDGAAILRGRSPSPGPRDLSLHSNPHHGDSDTDSSGHPDTSSVCSNGESKPIAQFASLSLFCCKNQDLQFLNRSWWVIPNYHHIEVALHDLKSNNAGLDFLLQEIS